MNQANPKVPDANKIKKAISGDLSENSQHVTVKDNGEILACDKNTKIDLGAYGKGIGTDEAIKMIKKDKEITGAMVALGGSIAVYGEKSDGSDWNVGIQDPNGKDGEVLGGIKVKSGTSISTSGDYEKTFTDKKDRQTLLPYLRFQNRIQCKNRHQILYDHLRFRTQRRRAIYSMFQFRSKEKPEIVKEI